MKKSSLYIILSTLIAAMIIVIIIGSQSIHTAAENNTADMVRCYKTYEIQEDDTLWKISQEYAETYGCSVKEYLKELKTVNGITSDKVVAGTHLIVVYWE